MAMYGLLYSYERCPDGVELHDYGEPLRQLESEPRGQMFRSRTQRRDPVRLEIANLENPVVVEFVNARDDERAADFLSKYGLLTGEVPNHVARDFFYGMRELYFNWLHQAGGPRPTDALQAIEEASARTDHQPLMLVPRFDLGGIGGAPRMTLLPTSLEAFMVMEIATVAMQGAKFAECEHCHDVFLTGPLTGRRSHAKYCSARCRVAAMRARNAEQAKSE